ncbi:GNA1162 family protein [Burkholderia sp. L27(2015)]|uniref:DUF799 domain-containing protein n=1 Tax=Burkholderia sp. L27(2015) TaxID=1641858 RepID=UPI00131C6A01|nr:GNA1162 family protein [Burkholderia sp. L27(2015)]
MRLFKFFGIAASVSTLAACVQAPVHLDYSALRNSDPHSILIVPVINRSVDVDAPDYFLSTISRPIAERGYYVFPVNLTKRVMEDDGLSDANMVHAQDPTKLGKMFGADAIMYITIDRWDARYLVISTTVTVELEYVLKSGTTGQTLWKHHQRVFYQPQGSSGGNPLATLIVAAVQAAIAKAKPNYIPLAQRANFLSVGMHGQGLPAGPYDSQYKADITDY